MVVTFSSGAVPPIPLTEWKPFLGLRISLACFSSCMLPEILCGLVDKVYYASNIPRATSANNRNPSFRPLVEQYWALLETQSAKYRPLPNI